MRHTIPSLLFITAVLMIGSRPVFAQQDKSLEKVKLYNAIVDVTIQKKNMVGVLTKVGDSAIYLIIRYEKVRIPSNVIKQIRIKRKGSVGRGALAGSMVGLGVGAIIGLASGDDTCDMGQICFMPATAEEKALAGGIILSGVGALVGMVLGSSAKERVVVGENQFVFEKNVELLRKYSLGEDQ